MHYGEIGGRKPKVRKQKRQSNETRIGVEIYKVSELEGIYEVCGNRGQYTICIIGSAGMDALEPDKTS